MGIKKCKSVTSQKNIVKNIGKAVLTEDKTRYTTRYT